MTKPSLRTRVLLIDLLKALAAQIIVLHHITWYGPLSDLAAELGPGSKGLIAFLANYGRYAVVVFFVTSGFLAAQLLSPRGLGPHDQPACLIRERFFRLTGPFSVALLLAILCTALARQWMSDAALGTPPGFGQLLAHMLLLHGVLGVESITAGAWYVAIDFQLYFLLVLLLWLGGRFLRRPASADYFGSFGGEFSAALPVLGVALASLFYFNRDMNWDVTGLYFFGTYALGVVSGWAIRSSYRTHLLWLIALAGVIALLIDFRPRIAIGLVTALLLGWSSLHMSRREMRLIHYFGGTSYALFLVHFPVFLLTSAIFQHYWSGQPGMGAVGLFVAWIVSNLLADLFHRGVELPFARWRKHRMRCSIA